MRIVIFEVSQYEGGCHTPDWYLLPCPVTDEFFAELNAQTTTQLHSSDTLVK